MKIKNKTIIPDSFYENLSKSIAEKAYDDGLKRLTSPGHYGNSDESYESRPRFEQGPKIEAGANAEFIRSQIIKFKPENMSLGKLFKILELDDLITKLYDVSDWINYSIDSIRYAAHHEAYDVPYKFREYNDEEPESYYTDEKGRHHIYHTAKIEKILSRYMAHIEEVLINNTPADKIQVSTQEEGDWKPRVDKSRTRDLQFLVDISRGDDYGFSTALEGNIQEYGRNKI